MSIPEEIKSIQIQILDLNEDSQQKSAAINRLESVLKSEINSAVGDDIPGGVRVNYNNIQSLGKEERTEIIQMIKDENTPSYFLQWN